MRGFWLCLGLVLTAILLPVSGTWASPAVASRYNEIKMQQEQCLKNAEEALRQDKTEQSRYGARGEYTDVVRCIAENGLVFFIGSGPSRNVANNLSGALFSNFEGGLH
jgi:hypothetical protein